jgi:hypothetical protein
VVINNELVPNYNAVVDANYSIALTIDAKCGNIFIGPAFGQPGVTISVSAGRCPATVSFVATNRTYTEGTITVTSVPSSEYAVSFDRWFSVPYDWFLGQYNVLYRATGRISRTAVLQVLSYDGMTAICAVRTDVAQAGEDDVYTYRLTLRGVEVVNYRTLEVVLPWRTACCGKAIVNITAYNITSNGRNHLRRSSGCRWQVC